MTPRAVSYCAELDSAQYHTVLRRINLEKIEYLCENETKFENILTLYSAAKADSNYETNRLKISFDCPLGKVT